MKDLVSIEDITRNEMENIFDLASHIDENELWNERSHTDKTVAGLFYSPSSRTKDSTRLAALNLGCKIIGFNNPKTSSTEKGESFEDTVRLYSEYVTKGGGGLIFIRHPEKGSAKIASQYSKVPIINCGDGSNEHPTQTLIDLYTIKKYKNRIDGLNVCIIGDLKYGRTVHSLLLGLKKFRNIQISLAALGGLEIPEKWLGQITHPCREVSLPLGFIDFDVLYVTRVQKEHLSQEEKQKVAKQNYHINYSHLTYLDRQTLIMHPLPRDGEIDPEIDRDTRSIYFEQAANGVPVRMALMEHFLGEK